MSQPLFPARRHLSTILVPLLAALMLLVPGCAPYRAAPPPDPVAPSSYPTVVADDEWELAAVRYQFPGTGINLENAGLTPVLLIVRNKGDRYPLIWPGEVNGTLSANQYLPLNAQQAAQIVVSTEAGAEAARAAIKGAAAGAVIGAGLGALFAAPIGGNAVWQSALFAGGMGAVAGAATAAPATLAEFQLLVDEDLYAYSWKPLPVPPHATVNGYFYFQAPASPAILNVVIRAGADVHAYAVPIADPPVAAPAASGGASGGQRGAAPLDSPPGG